MSGPSERARKRRGVRRSLVVAAALLALAPVSGAATLSSADILWESRFPGAALSIDVDPGQIYVGGFTRPDDALPGQESSGLEDAFLRRYGRSGRIVWTRQFGTPGEDRIDAVRADGGGGGLYAGGSVFGDDSPDALVRRYRANGHLVWSRQFGTPQWEWVLALATDESTLYAAGFTWGSLPGQVNAGQGDAFLRAYDRAGDELWTRQFGTSAYDAVYGVAAFAGRVYVVGHTEGALEGEYGGQSDPFIRAYDAQGNRLWGQQFGTEAIDGLFAVAADRSGIYVGGDTNGTIPGGESSGGYDAFLRAYDIDGEVRWTRQFGTVESDRIGGRSSVALRSTSPDVPRPSVVVTGWTRGAFPGETNVGGRDSFVLAYDKDGNPLWTTQFGTPDDDGGNSVATATADIYVAGSSPTYPNYDASVARLRVGSRR